jgi:hypothetical protein
LLDHCIQRLKKKKRQRMRNKRQYHHPENHNYYSNHTTLPTPRLYLIVQAPKIVSWLIHPFRNVFFQLFTNDRWIGFDWFFVPRPTVGREQGNKEWSVCVHTAQKGIKGALYLFNVGQYFVPMDLEMFLMNSKRLWPETMGLPILT